MIGQDYLGIKRIRDEKRYKDRPLDMPQCIQEIKSRQTQQVIFKDLLKVPLNNLKDLLKMPLNNLQFTLIWGPLLLWRIRKTGRGECLQPQQDSAHPRPHPFLTCGLPRPSCHAVGGKGRQGKKTVQEDYPMLPRDKTMTDYILWLAHHGPQWTAREV